VGERQFGPYRLVRQIAVGGMAEIHLAKATGIAGFEKYVAIKMIHPNFAEDDQFIQMLVDEAKIAVQLTHGNIAQTFDLGRVGDTYYITMEYVDGADLYKILRRASEQDLAMPLDVCAFVGKEISSALDHAHRKRDHTGKSLGIVHRDVSPQNVLVSFSGEVKLVDFGIAKAAMKVRQTAAGVIKGKYYYMSPEQAWGDPIDHRSDIFSAGIVLYEMITGQMLYLEEDLHKLLEMARSADIAPPSQLRRGVPPQLERIVMHALEKVPGERYQSAGDFATDLERFLHAYSPVFTASKLSTLLRQVVGDPMQVPDEPAFASVEFRDGVLSTHPLDDAEVAHATDRAGLRDENSVIFRVSELEKPRPLGNRPPQPRASTPQPVSSAPQPVSSAPAMATPRPATPRPATPRSEMPRPATPRSEMPRPATPRPTTPRPETPWSEMHRPETPRPDMHRPESRPEMARPATPRSETPRPEMHRPESRPEMARPATPRSEMSRPESRPEMARPATPRSEMSRPETPRPETPRPETPRPETPRPETHRPGTPRPVAPSKQSAPRITRAADPMPLPPRSIRASDPASPSSGRLPSITQPRVAVRAEATAPPPRGGQVMKPREAHEDTRRLESPAPADPLHDESSGLLLPDGTRWDDDRSDGFDDELENIGERTLITGAPMGGFMMDVGDDQVEATLVTTAPTEPFSDDETTLDRHDEVPTRREPTLERASPRARPAAPPPAALSAKIHAPAVSELRKPRPSRRTPGTGAPTQPPNVLHAIVSSHASEPMPAPRPTPSQPRPHAPSSSTPPPVSAQALPATVSSQLPVQPPPATSPPMMAQLPPTMSPEHARMSATPLPVPSQAMTLPESFSPHSAGTPGGQPSYSNDASGLPMGVPTPPGMTPQPAPGVPPHLQPYLHMQGMPPGYVHPHLATQMSPHGYPQMSPSALHQFQPPPQEMSLTGQMRLLEIDELPSQYRLVGTRRRWLTYVVSGTAAVAVAAIATFLIIRAIRDTAPRFGNLTIESSPGGASVLFDGTLLAEKTPFTVPKVAAGSNHKLEFLRAGHRSSPITFTMPRSGDYTVTGQLTPIVGRINVFTKPANAEVYVDDVLKGRSPMTVPDVSIETTRKIEIRLKDHRSYVKEPKEADWSSDGRLDINYTFQR
jgi:serine/threonine protein kinase